MRNVFLTAVLLLAIGASPGLAQKVGPNGGTIYEKNGHGIEIVVTATDVSVYLSHDGKPSKAEGYTLRALVQQGSTTTPVALIEVEGTRLTGGLVTPLEKGAIVVITGKDHHGDSVTARHVVK